MNVLLVDLNLDLLRDDDLRWADVVLTGGLLIQEESIREVIVRAHAFRLPVAVGGPAPTTSQELPRGPSFREVEADGHATQE